MLSLSSVFSGSSWTTSFSFSIIVWRYGVIWMFWFLIWLFWSWFMLNFSSDSSYSFFEVCSCILISFFLSRFHFFLYSKRRMLGLVNDPRYLFLSYLLGLADILVKGSNFINSSILEVSRFFISISEIIFTLFLLNGIV